jgi:HEAT repeat protein
MSSVREYVVFYAAQLAGPNGENAWHSLVEAGPTALPHLAEALDASADPRVRAALLRVVSEYRSAEAVPLLKGLLGDPDAEVWTAALDGLVMLGGPVAVDALIVVKATVTSERQEWIDEGIRQILDARKPG